MNQKIRKRAMISHDLCVACGSCEKVCPKHAINIFWGMYAVVDKAVCIGCGICEKNCPASIITIEIEREA